MLQKEDFLKGMTRLSEWYNRRFTDDQLEIYYEVIKPIPVVPWCVIVEHIIDTCKAMPPRKDIKRMWYEWLKANPEKVHIVKATDCPECDSSGGIDFWYIPKDHKERGISWESLKERGLDKTSWGGIVYKAIARCGHCENWKGRLPGSLIRKTTAELVDLGVIPIVREKSDNAEKIIDKGDIEKMAEQVGNKMPEEQMEVPF